MKIQSLLNRKSRNRTRNQRHGERSRSRSRLLRFESMEVRALLAADFGLSGGTLTLDNFTQVDSESLVVGEDGSSYRFGLSEGTWAMQGSPQPGISLASNGQVLEIEKSLLAGGTISEILVSDTAGIDFDVAFEDINLQSLSGALALLDVGHVTQTAGSFVRFGQFDVTAASVTLAESGNDFGSVRAMATAGGVTLFDVDDILLGTPGQADTAGVNGGNYVVTALGTITVSADHTIDSIGDSAVSLTAARNISLEEGASITTIDGGITLQANQQATPTSGSFIGIDLNGATIISTGAGEVKLHGTGGNEKQGLGIRLTSGAVIIGGSSGAVEVLGSGGASSINTNYGVWVTDSGSQITSSGGDVRVEGIGGGTGASGYNYGVYVSSGGVITSSGTDASVTVQGRGGNTSGTGGNYNHGVWVTHSGSRINSNGGAVLVDGTGGGAANSLDNYGVFVVSGGLITSSGTDASVTVRGRGGNTTGTGGNDNHGVLVISNKFGSSQITSSGGDVRVEGIGGGSGASEHNYGVYVASGGVITSLGAAAAVTVQGSGGNTTGTGSFNRGVWVSGSGSQITSSGGAIEVTGEAGSGTSSHGVLVDDDGQILASMGTPTVGLTADSMELLSATSIDAGGNRVVLRPVSAGTRIDLGGDDGFSVSPLTLGLTDAELNRISAGTLVIGDENTGTVTVSTSMQHAGDADIRVVSGRNMEFDSGSGWSTVDGNLSFIANQQATPTSGNFMGIDVNGATIMSSGAGEVKLHGRGGDEDTNNHGVRLRSGGVISGGTAGTVELLGSGGASSGNSNYGVLASDPGSRITSSGGAVLVNGTGGGTDTSNFNVGVFVDSSGVITSVGTNAIVTVKGNGGNTSGTGGDVNFGVHVSTSAVIMSSGGAVLVEGTGGGAGAGGSNHGMVVRSGGSVKNAGTANTATVQVRGFAGNSSPAGASHGAFVTGNNSLITSSGGGVLVEGTGASTGGFRDNHGVLITSAGLITNAGTHRTATVTVKGFGGALGQHGVNISGINSAISSSGGEVLVEGTGGGRGGANGVLVGGHASITSSGDEATVTIIGRGGDGAGTSDNNGVHVNGTSALITSSGGAVYVEGIGGGTGNSHSNRGVYVVSGGVITNAGTHSMATVTVRGHGGNDSGDGLGGNHGVHVNSSNSLITSSGGAVLVEGTGGGAGTSSNNYGVSISSSGVITSGGTDASVTVTGSGGGGDGERNYGVYVGAGQLSSGGAGIVSVTGVGGAGAGGDNHGVYVQTGEITSGGGDVLISGQGSENTESTLRSYGVEVGGSLISAGGLGNVTITGVGGAGLSQRNYGVYVRSVAVITSNGGDVSVWGQGGDGDSSLNYGVMTTGDAEITSGGSGNVAVTGIGGTGAGSNNVGLYLSPSTITSGGAGTVTVLGQGGGNADSGGGNRGILMSSAVITSGGIGHVTVSGFGGAGPVGSNDGIFFLPGNANGVNSGDTVRITSGGGDVNVLGHAGDGPANQKRGIDLGAGSGGGMIASGNHADIAITTDGLWVGDTAEVVIDSGTGKTTLRPYSSGTLLNLGGPSSAATNPPTLGFTPAVMEKFTAGTLVIGDTDSGTLTVTADIARTAATNMQLISGDDIVISGGSIDTGGGTLSLHAGDSPAAIRPTRTGTDVKASTLALANDLAIVIDGTAVDVDYTQLSVVGTVDLTGVDLVLTGSYNPVDGDAFTIVSATGVSGQFNGLADGDQLMLGGQSLTIQYSSTGVTLNVTVELNTTHVTLDDSGNLLVTDTATSGKNDDLRIHFDGSSYTIEDLTGLPIEVVGVAGSGGSGTASVTIPKTSITGAKIIFNVLDGDDLLTVDAGTPGEHTIEYHGGGGSNALNLVGATIHTSSYTYASATDGSIALDPDGPGPAAPWTISYTGLTPLTSSITSDVVELVYAGGSETISVSDAGGGQTTVASTLGAATTFVNPTALLTIQTTSGSDVINVDSLATGYASLHIAGNDTGDVVNFNGPLTFAADHSLTVLDVGVISLPNTTSDLATSGTGAVRLTALKNIALSSGSSISTVDGDLTLSANQQDPATGGNFSGIEIDNATISSTSGAITLKGRGGDEPGQQFGVYIHSSAIVGAETTGAVTIIGKGGNTTGDEGNANQGVRVVNAMIGSGGGDISVTGTGGGSGASANNYGLFLVSGGEITAGGTGSVTAVGFGGNTSGTGGSLNHGVFVQSSNSRIHSGGDVSVTGTGAGIGSNNFGVSVFSGGTITASGTGNVTVEGSGSIGVSVFSANSLITSAGGDVSVNGDGSGVGVRVEFAGQITAEGSGSVTVQGAGGSDGSSAHGVSVSGSGSQIIAGDGGLSITGTAGGESGAHGFIVRDSGELNTTGSGTISITADRIHLGANVNAGASAVSLLPKTSGTAIDLGGADAPGTLGLTNAELNRITAGTLRIGSEDAGAIHITQPISPAGTDTLHLITGGGVDGGDNGAIAVPQLAISSVGSVRLQNWVLGNSVQLFAAATTGPGSGIHFENDGALTIGTVDGRSGLSVNGGGITIITHSPLTIHQPVVDVGGGNITLTATNDGGDDDHLTINASVQASGGSGNVELNAGTNLILGAGTTVSTTGSGTISATATQTTELSTQATLTTEGGDVTLQTQDVVISGTDSDDEISLQPSGDEGGVELTINGVSLVFTPIADGDPILVETVAADGTSNAAPLADAGANRTAMKGELIHFSGSFTDTDPGDTHAIVWDFGDGTDAVVGTLTPEHTYVDSGTYTVSLTVTDSGGLRSVDTLTVTVIIATPTIAIDWTGGTYNGSEFVASGSVNGFDGSEIATPTFTYFVGVDTTGTQLVAAPVNAGTYTVQADFSGDALHLAASATATIVIGKADATIVVGSTTVTYDGNAHGATGAATGVNGETLAGLDLGGSFTNVPGGTANWGFTDVTGNYNDASESVEITISQRSVTVTADNQTKVYGTAAPALTYGITSGNLVATDAFFGELVREPGENVGSYAITQGSLGLSDNYDLSFVDADLEITHAILTGDATTQDALNMAKQGLLEVTVTSIEGFVNGENSDVFLSSATFWITIEGTKYEFEPTSVTKLSDTSISISYKLKNSALQENLAEALELATSGATALEAGFSMESTNYRLSDDELTRLFCTVK